MLDRVFSMSVFFCCTATEEGRIKNNALDRNHLRPTEPRAGKVLPLLLGRWRTSLPKEVTWQVLNASMYLPTIFTKAFQTAPQNSSSWVSCATQYPSASVSHRLANHPLPSRRGGVGRWPRLSRLGRALSPSHCTILGPSINIRMIGLVTIPLSTNPICYRSLSLYQKAALRRSARLRGFTTLDASIAEA